MQFRDFNEHFGDGGSSWDLLYPTTAGDYADVNNNPLQHFWLQWKWDRGTEPDIGRTLHNIDNDKFQKIGYNSLASTSMPDTKDGFWKHKPDDGSKGSLQPYHLEDLRWVAIGKTSKDTKFVDKDSAGKIKIWSGLGPTSTVDDTNLDDIFHDEDTHTHSWPSVNTKYMDEDWTKPEHRSSFKEWFVEYGLASGAAGGLPWSGHASDGETNRTMPVASKWVTKDGQNKGDDPDDMPDPDASFGYKGRPKDKKRRKRTIHNRNIKPRRIDVSDIIY